MSERNKAVVEFLQDLDIETVKFGGFDKEDVFIHLKELSDLYEREREWLVIEREKLLEQATAANAELLKNRNTILDLQKNLNEAQETCRAMQNNAAAVVGGVARPSDTNETNGNNQESALYNAFIDEFKQFSAERRAEEKFNTETAVVREELRQCKEAIDRTLRLFESHVGPRFKE